MLVCVGAVLAMLGCDVYVVKYQWWSSVPHGQRICVRLSRGGRLVLLSSRCGVLMTQLLSKGERGGGGDKKRGETKREMEAIRI